MELSVLLVSVVLATVVAALVWSLKLARTCEKTEDKEKCQKSGRRESGKPQSSNASKQVKKKPAAAPVVKESKAAFTHSWLLTTLKGHTGNVLDMDFSPDGKHIVTCSEEVDDVFVSPPTPVENPTPSETDSGSILSRRQKRNRSKKKVVKKKTEKQAPKKVEVKAQSRKTTPLKYYSRLRMSKMELYNYLSKYVLSDDQLLNLGYPVESAFCPEKAIIYKSPEANITYYRNGQLSELTDRFYEDERHWLSQKRPPLSPSLEKRCVRCRKGFFVTQDGEYLTEESCTYHWGTWKKTSDTCGYTCCQGDSKSGGCSTGKFHVWNGVSPGMNGPFSGYARTRSCPSDSAHCDVYALDCEMCYTGLGLEVCKVTVISTDGCLVYETLVKPDRPVVDYNTRFSGLNASHLDSTKKRLRDVQKDLLRLIYTETILIGHGLENDLRALGLLHSRVIDTAVLFPHYYGFPFRRSLKSLVSTYLRRDIQVGRDGHDSYEDARACAELVLWKATRELRLKSETLEEFPVLN